MVGLMTYTCDAMTYSQFLEDIRSDRPIVVGPYFRDSGIIDYNVFAREKVLGWINIDNYKMHYDEFYSELCKDYIGIIIDTPTGYQIWRAEKVICHTTKGAAIFLNKKLDMKLSEVCMKEDTIVHPYDDAESVII